MKGRHIHWVSPCIFMYSWNPLFSCLSEIVLCFLSILQMRLRAQRGEGAAWSYGACSLNHSLWGGESALLSKHTAKHLESSWPSLMSCNVLIPISNSYTFETMCFTEIKTRPLHIILDSIHETWNAGQPNNALICSPQNHLQGLLSGADENIVKSGAVSLNNSNCFPQDHSKCVRKRLIF